AAPSSTYFPPADANSSLPSSPNLKSNEKTLLYVWTELCSTSSTSLTDTGRPRTKKTTLTAKSNPNSTKATPATTSSFRHPSAPSSTNPEPASPTRTFPNPITSFRSSTSSSTIKLPTSRSGNRP